MELNEFLSPQSNKPMNFMFYQKYHNQLTLSTYNVIDLLVTYMSVQGHFRVKTHQNGHKNE